MKIIISPKIMGGEVEWSNSANYFEKLRVHSHPYLYLPSIIFVKILMIEPKIYFYSAFKQ